MAAIVDSPINLEAGRQPKSPKTKPAAMVGGRRRPQGKPQKTKAEGDDDRAPPVIESIIVPVEVPEGDELVTIENPPPAKERNKFPPRPKVKVSSSGANQKTKNAANRKAGGGISHSVQRPQNVGSNGWA
eukprot:CAMPEP_0182948822 /NCGR_PEP_ID=MMETSP0105_2-20130417/59940_1 /TAXON_ID=81532 ORGANISM="Acanthoeca-like sp., Strain 10tr" /NCGR_SAMPLE_ID=MMETSP0105_2 /ASSEMBLY_ACC=CAM_ASM_000205 /LENGTH=129 /DNA_ID=CAMNT_0025089117 /DNA_START=687 /DNA_END=1076 /DNA_ORIENTATION=+